jgi:hypothetical protein
MNPNNCRTKPRRETRHITIRIDEDTLHWLKRNRYSATAIFREAIKELGYKQQRRN